MPQQSAPPALSGVERDPRIFTWFLTLVMVTMYTVSLLEKPALRAFPLLAYFTLLFTAHIFLHWQIERIFDKPKLLFAYILVQGGVGFAICQMAAHEAVIFAIYMALFGEAIGMFGLTRRSLLATIYYFSLAFISIQQVSTNSSVALLAVTTVPVLIFLVMYIVLYRRQTDAREQAQILAGELEAANRQLTEYAAQVEDLTIAAERTRLARDLHDTLSQGLVGLILQLEAVDAHLNLNHPEKAHQIIAQAMVKARETLADSRRAISNLRENNVVELRPSLRRAVDRFQSATGIPCTFQVDQIPQLSDSLTETILRGVNEALTNIARHAQASKASLTLSTSSTMSVGHPGEVEAQALVVTITDDGIGFDPQNIPPGHFGLLGIRERIRMLGGNLYIESGSDKGTILSIKIPLPRDSHSEPDTP